MKYTKFIIKNFKGIKGELERDLTKLPSSNIFTFVGLNESGKTSILEAINLLQTSSSKEDAHKLIHKSKKCFSNKMHFLMTFYLPMINQDRLQLKFHYE